MIKGLTIVENALGFLKMIGRRKDPVNYFRALCRTSTTVEISDENKRPKENRIVILQEGDLRWPA